MTTPPGKPRQALELTEGLYHSALRSIAAATPEARPHTPAELAQLALQDATARRAAMRARIAAAETDLATATAAHERLVLGTGNGAPMAVHETVEADRLMRAAASVVDVLKAALPGYDRDIAAAQERGAQVARDERTAEWRRVIADRLVVAEEVDRTMAELERLYAKWQANSEALFPVWDAGRAPSSEETRSINDPVVFVRAAPTFVQDAIRSYGGGDREPLAVATRSVWGRFAKGDGS